jgi:autotransporter-associated beta strand protein
MAYAPVTNTDDSGVLTLDGTNTYGGTTTINAGTLRVGGGEAIPDFVSPFSTGAVVLANNASAVLELSATETIGSLSGGGTTGGNVQLSANTTGNSTSTTFDGVIDGIGGLTKAGTGTFTLTGANGYLGATTINAGTLQVDGSIANSATTLNAGATLGGTGTVGTVAVNGGTLSPGASPGILNTGNLSFVGGGSLKVEIGSTGAGHGGSDSNDVVLTELNDAPVIHVPGRIDAVTTNQSSNTVSVLLNNGAGGLSPGGAVAAGGNTPASTALGDVNDDGLVDAVTAGGLSTTTSAHCRSSLHRDPQRTAAIDCCRNTATTPITKNPRG